MDPAPAYTGTGSGDLFPSLWAYEVRAPEGIAPALKGSSFVDRAQTVFPKHAVQIGPLDEADSAELPQFDDPAVPSQDLIDRKTLETSDVLQIPPR